MAECLRCGAGNEFIQGRAAKALPAEPIEEITESRDFWKREYLLMEAAEKAAEERITILESLPRYGNDEVTRKDEQIAALKTANDELCAEIETMKQRAEIAFDEYCNSLNMAYERIKKQDTEIIALTAERNALKIDLSKPPQERTYCRGCSLITERDKLRGALENIKLLYHPLTDAHKIAADALKEAEDTYNSSSTI